uniref:Uncharacterized protein n=1 Tax=Anguilla anguilla TaxID=7936 RepID=A0A0E9U3Z5_ANGAN
MRGHFFLSSNKIRVEQNKHLYQYPKYDYYTPAL